MFLVELLVKKSFSDLYFKKNYLELIHNSFLQQIQEVVTLYKDETSGIDIDNKTKKKNYI